MTLTQVDPHLPGQVYVGDILPPTYPSVAPCRYYHWHSTNTTSNATSVNITVTTNGG